MIEVLPAWTSATGAPGRPFFVLVDGSIPGHGIALYKPDQALCFQIDASNGCKVVGWTFPTPEQIEQFKAAYPDEPVMSLCNSTEPSCNALKHRNGSP